MKAFTRLIIILLTLLLFVGCTKDENNPTQTDIKEPEKETPSTVGLIAYFPFNGNANDVSGNQNNATLNTATIIKGRKSNGDSCYLFNGSTRIVTPTNNFPIGGSSRTISAWVWSENFGQGNKMFVGYGNPSVPKMSALGIGHAYSTNRRPFFWGYGTDLVAKTSLSNNSWHHIAVVYSSSDSISKYYINSVLDTSATLPIKLNTPSGSLLYIGWFYTTLSGFSGAIDDIRIYNRELTDKEIQVLYNE